MLTLKRADLHDHDVIVIGPSFEALSNLARDITQPSPKVSRDAGLDFSVERPVPLSDATLQPAATDTIHVDAGAAIAPPGERSRLRRSVKRAVTGLMIMLLGAVSTLVWRAHGDEATQIVARWTPPIALPAWLQSRIRDAAEPLSQPPVGSADAALQAQQPEAPQPAAQAPVAQQATPSAQVAPETAAPAASAARLDAMARDLAAAQQAIEQLKGSQDQMAREIARLREQDARRRSLAAAPRPALGSAGKPVPGPLAARAAIQPRLAPSVPAAAPTPPPAQSSSVPRPPSPLP